MELGHITATICERSFDERCELAGYQLAAPYIPHAPLRCFGDVSERTAKLFRYNMTTVFEKLSSLPNLLIRSSRCQFVSRELYM